MNRERWKLNALYLEKIHFSNFGLCRSILLSFHFVAFCSAPSFAQIYNYSPISYKDFETNPAYLATNEMNNIFDLSHQNSFNSTDVFSSTNLKYSTYLPSSFLGFGVSLTSTQIRNNVRMHHAGFGAAYRTVVFNKLYLRLGAMYKLLETNEGPGIYDYYSFDPSNAATGAPLNHSINTSFSLNSENDRFFLSLGMSNIPISSKSTLGYSEFPTYYTMHIGNLISLFSRGKGSEISYTGFIKTIDKVQTFNHYFNVKFNYKLSRKSILAYGSQLGYSENSYFHFIPTVGYLRKKIQMLFSYNFQLDKSTFQPVNFESFKLRLTLTL